MAVTTPNTVQALKKNYNLKQIFLWRNGVDIKFFKPEINNLSFRKNSHLLLKNKMEDLSVNDVQDYIVKNKLLDKVE